MTVVSPCRSLATLSFLLIGLGVCLRTLSLDTALAEAADDEAPAAKGIKPHDNEPRIAIQFADDTSRFGITCTRLKDPRYAERLKMLTSHEKGLKNNTRVLVDGYDWRFGMETPNVRYFRDKKGDLWKEKEVKNPVTGNKLWVTIMDWKNERVRVTQSVEVIVGEQTALYDTALVRYTLENADEKQHTVGLRMLLDTFIGADDGVPFEVGPSDEVKAHPLVDKRAIFEKNQVPAFLRAIEEPGELDGKNNTVVEMGLKLKGFEPIQKLVLCRWPKGKGEGQANWDWEFDPIDAQPTDKDSCVVLYWSKIVMPANDKRVCGFTYGLGRIAGEPAGPAGKPSRFSNKLRLFARPAVVDREFVISAYFKGGVGNVQLVLPPELELVAGKAEQPAKSGPVAWIVKCGKAGDYLVKALHPDGTYAQEPVHVSAEGLFE
jgi:hypothetical protein